MASTRLDIDVLEGIFFKLFYNPRWESQAIKNPSSKIFCCCHAVARCKQKLILTVPPGRNGAMDPLVSNWILSIQDTGESETSFKKQFSAVQLKNSEDKDKKGSSWILRWFKPFILRRLKSQVPPRTFGEDNQCQVFLTHDAAQEKSTRSEELLSKKIILRYTIYCEGINQQCTATSSLNSIAPRLANSYLKVSETTMKEIQQIGGRDLTCLQSYHFGKGTKVWC